MTALTQLAFDVTCHRCGGGLTVVNPGGTCGTESKTVLACLECGTEWAVTVLLRQLGGPPVGHRPGQRSTIERLDKLAAQARYLVDGGATVSHACRTVGITRHAYYHRLPAGS